ncbi:MAG: DUF1616 domain-containing protein [Thermoplasmata archaeon]|nr:DUF1616 domain-containing protein [Thermoplasmata archaeon]
MGAVDVAEAVAGLALVFFLPGFAVARATFPEWRFRGPSGTLRLLETLSLSLMTSVGVTVIVGFGLLKSPVGFQATWSDPLLLAILAALTAIGLVVALARGAFASTPPKGPEVRPEAGTEGAFETIRELDRLHAQERRVVHRLRVIGRDDPSRSALDTELAELRQRAAGIVAAREAEERGA